MYRKLSILLALSSLSFGAVACEDPADEVSAAAVVDESENSAENAAENTAENTETPEAPAEEAPAQESLAFSNDGSTIGFVGSKVTDSHEGGFREFAGTIAFSAADPTASQIEVTIQMASTFADDDRLANHLKDADFFNVAEFPTASFRSASIAAGGEGDATHTITGTLNLHGQEQTIRFPATVTVSDAEVAASAEFSINRQDFGINYAGMADDLIRDRVVIKLDLHAPRG